MSVRTPSACVLLLALLAAAPGASAKREHGIRIFTGPVQPDPGAGAGAARNGKAVAFAASFRDAGGGRYDPAATPTVFVWNRQAGDLRQVTATGPCDQPSAANGTVFVKVGEAEEKEHRTRTLVAFRSTANLAAKNADLSPEIFLWDSLNGAITQITQATSGASSAPALGARFVAEQSDDRLYTGNFKVRYRLAFLSTSDLTGDNPDGLTQVFHYDSGDDAVGKLVQVSHSVSGGAGPPAVDGEGKHVAFVHDGDLLEGPDAPGTPGVYVWSDEEKHGGLRRATEEPGACEAAADPALDPTGSVVAWSAEDGEEGPRRILVADGGRLRVASPSSGDHRAPTLGERGRSVVLLSTDPGDGGAPVAERPVALARGGRIRDLGLAGSPAYGSLLLQRDAPVLLLTTDADLDGGNAAGREVIYVVPLRR